MDCDSLTEIHTGDKKFPFAIFVKRSAKIKPYLLFFVLLVYSALQMVEHCSQAHSLSFGLLNYKININSVAVGENLIVVINTEDIKTCKAK